MSGPGWFPQALQDQPAFQSFELAAAPRVRSWFRLARAAEVAEQALSRSAVAEPVRLWFRWVAAATAGSFERAGSSEQSWLQLALNSGSPAA
jgi:hypothetical protein